MQAHRGPAVSDRNSLILPLARLLQKLESSPLAADPDQYRSVVGRLSDLLGQGTMDAMLDEILRAYPAAAELYENLHYAHAGLCRSPLEAAVEAEARARKLIAAA